MSTALKAVEATETQMTLIMQMEYFARSRYFGFKAPHVLKDDNGVTFTFSNSIKNIRKITISFDRANDLYDVRIFHMKNFAIVQDETISGLFAEDLINFF